MTSKLGLRYAYLSRPHYLHVGALQNHLVRQHLDYKVAHEKWEQISDPTEKSNTPQPVAPPPTLLVFNALPVYTCGRRDISKLSPADIGWLHETGASFFESPRGGQLTFHGRGQMTAYLICDLRQLKLSPRDYVRMLETASSRVVSRFRLTPLFFDAHPGVWVRHRLRRKGYPDRHPIATGVDQSWRQNRGMIRGVSAPVENDDHLPDSMRKIVSVGVHLRRNITSYGVGINVKTDLDYFRRIAACGLPGARVTSISEEGGWRGKGGKKGKSISVKQVGRFLAMEIWMAAVLGRRASDKDIRPVKVSEQHLWRRAKEMEAWDRMVRKDPTLTQSFADALGSDVPDSIPAAIRDGTLVHRPLGDLPPLPNRTELETELLEGSEDEDGDEDTYADTD